ncbi:MULTISPECIES: response regulator [Novosphingobium]|uniref:response regulator n=1 Tax=Novosphingobium TaxID=165696 RepID=UPI001CD2A479|nr:response regulator [Novosphingobium percolationis]MCH7627597.1 response regulator [Pseudomonadota bacterium]
MSSAAFRILCIEDNDELREDLVGELRDEGYEVIETGDGREGLEVIVAGGIDLVLCDVQLPSLDGIALLRELGRRMDVLPRIIMLTAFSDRATQDLALASGAVAVMVKPIDFGAVLAQAETLRHQRRA